MVAWSQVWGASVGTVSVFSQLIAAMRRTDTQLVVLLLLLALAFYAVSGTGALLMLRGKRTGLRLVKLGLIPQLAYAQTATSAYMLLSGFYVLLYFQGGVAGINFGIYSKFVLHIGAGPFSPGLGLNVLALAMLIYLMRVDPFLEAERAAYPARPESELGRNTPDAG